MSLLNDETAEKKKEVASNESVHEELASITIQIKGKSYIIDLSELIKLKTDITSDLSNIELEQQLEKISSYLHTISVAYEEIHSKKWQKELEFDIWYKKKQAEAEEAIFARMQKEVKEGIRSKSNTAPTKAQIEAWIVTKYGDEYKRLFTELQTLKEQSDFLFREFKILSGRGTHLQTILKSRKALEPLT